MASPVRVRFAPSPTGYLHVGGARTALFNYLFARRHRGTFVLRIEDTDQDRNVEAALSGILDGLKWLGLPWDEGPEVGGPFGPYFQSERLPRYAEAAARLLAAGKVYRCFCDPEELKRKREGALARGEPPKYDRTCLRLSQEESVARVAKGEPFALRFLMPEGETSWEDEVRGTVTFQNGILDDLVILRSDQHPTYNFAAVVDDAAMEITHVLRGDDHISNTPRQIQLYAALGTSPPRFGHLPMILGPDGTRLSKRHGAVSVTAFRDDGILPAAMVNFLALLGWAFDGEREMFTMDELVDVFTLDRVSKNPAIFNYEKLDWMNGEYFRALPLSTRAAMVASYLKETGALPESAVADRGSLERAVAAVGDRMKRPRQFLEYAGYLYVDRVEPEAQPWAELVANPHAAARLRKLATVLSEVEPFEHDPIEKVVRGLASSEGVKAGEVIMPARIALTGKKVSPGIFDVMLLLGRERTAKRLRDAADRLNAQSPAPTA
ncbi:MAG: glutamate--tRNA ligase [Candidatus Eisenbacteria bacterium]|uniref:Glutamate--tRNA ligase n=1 Tax=Eiseniibacteriota bacterium TaxID=2212470 RepID=A0A538TKQ2_UNCEI|nr:MAG: glutamate--tRNA ligase [Candidatus Eisenbacteria bacterium]